ncbi:MAG: hypothetical protein QOD77_1979 [Thermoplasmata archaeon]|jgi:hypothetical protein|nr:hypothetical protein [Thermoplasmata archaeon]
MDPPPDLPEEARLWLVARQKELERDHADKLRELKAQHRRRMQALEEERADWHATRRQQAQQLADKAETVRRRVEVREQKAEVAAAVHDELAARRGQVQAFETAEREWARERARLEAERAATQARLRAARRQALVLASLLVVGAVAWLVSRSGS